MSRQNNYFIEEPVTTGKGANATISYAHDFLENHGTGETSVHFHADNVAAKTKTTTCCGIGALFMVYTRTSGILSLSRGTQNLVLIGASK